MFSIICMVMVMFTACKPDVEPVEPTYNFDSVIAADFGIVSSMSSDFIFYESEVQFTNVIDSLEVPQIAAIKNVFQSNDTCIMITHEQGNVGKEPIIEIVKDFWLGDFDIDMNTVPCTLEQSWILLKSANIAEGLGDKMTFRRPVNKYFDEYPSYIYGTMGTGFVRVFHTGDKVLIEHYQ